ncbi:MAG: hypothetical protein ACI4PV_03755 [Butyricicoccus sp.]
MILHFSCGGWPDPTMVRRRLESVAGLGTVDITPDGRALTVQPVSAASALEATLRLRELGWRRTL